MKIPLCYAQRVRRKRRLEVLKIFVYVGIFYAVVILLSSKAD